MTNQYPRPTKPRPVISVCIANYNGEKYLKECLESVYNQDTDTPFEVLVHDDASSDNSVALIKKLFPETIVIISETNSGFCISNDRMAEKASGEFLLLLNNDATLRQGSLTALTKFSQGHRTPCIIGLPQYTKHDGELIDRGYEQDIFMNPIPSFHKGTHEVGFVTGACLWVPKTIWNAVNGFPSWFGSIAEDVYLCQAARLIGYPTFILSGPGFDHWIGSNLGGGKVVDQKLETTVRRRALSERNKTAVMLVCYPWWTLTAVLPVHIALLLIEATALLLNGRGPSKVAKIYFPILPHVWRHRRELLTLRDRLMRQKKASDLTFMRRFQIFPHNLPMFLRHGMPSLK